MCKKVFTVCIVCGVLLTISGCNGFKKVEVPLVTKITIDDGDDEYYVMLSYDDNGNLIMQDTVEEYEYDNEYEHYVIEFDTVGRITSISEYGNDMDSGETLYEAGWNITYDKNIGTGIEYSSNSSYLSGYTLKLSYDNKKLQLLYEQSEDDDYDSPQEYTYDNDGNLLTIAIDSEDILMFSYNEYDDQVRAERAANNRSYTYYYNRMEDNRISSIDMYNEDGDWLCNYAFEYWESIEVSAKQAELLSEQQEQWIVFWLFAGGGIW